MFHGLDLDTIAPYQIRPNRPTLGKHSGTARSMYHGGVVDECRYPLVVLADGFVSSLSLLTALRILDGPCVFHDGIDGTSLIFLRWCIFFPEEWY